MSKPRLRVKICGLTRPEDARLAVDLGADLIGLNFYRPSPRFVDPVQAREIAAAVKGETTLVGVFVNHGPAEVEAIAAGVGLDLLQFHGDESVEEIAPFGARAIKVFRGAELTPAALTPYDECWGFLFDAPHEELYGGSGRAWAYAELAAVMPQRPTLVAGGVGPHNVARLRDVLPKLYGVDVCSRVELAPGVKDRALLEQLFAEVSDGEDRA